MLSFWFEWDDNLDTESTVTPNIICILFFFFLEENVVYILCTLRQSWSYQINVEICKENKGYTLEWIDFIDNRIWKESLLRKTFVWIQQQRKNFMCDICWIYKKDEIIKNLSETAFQKVTKFLLSQLLAKLSDFIRESGKVALTDHCLMCSRSENE